MSSLRILAFLGCCLLILQCKEEPTLIAPKSGQEYYPVDSFSKTYSVQTLRYNEFTGEVDTTSYLAIDSVIEYSSLKDTIQVRIERYRLSDDSGKVFVSNKILTRSKTQVLRSDGSELMVDFVFPVAEKRLWNIYSYSANTPVFNQFKQKERAFRSYPNTVQVVQRVTDNRVETDSSICVYAWNCGLIYSKKVNIEKDFETGAVISGYSTEEQLIP